VGEVGEVDEEVTAAYEEVRDAGEEDCCWADAA
jgi:hypothetical protein